MVMTLIALQRIIKSFDAHPVEDLILWFLLLDTTSSIPDLLPQVPDVPSTRLTEGYYQPGNIILQLSIFQ